MQTLFASRWCLLKALQYVYLVMCYHGLHIRAIIAVNVKPISKEFFGTSFNQGIVN